MPAIVEEGGWAYGLQLPIQTLTRTLVDPWEDSATVADLVAVARKAESTGHSFVGVCDHVAVPDDDYASRMTTTWYDTVATLGFLAAHTTTVRLLSVVWIAAYRHPLQTAELLRHARPPLGRPGDPGRRRGARRRASSGRSACRSPSAGRSSTRRWRR